MKKELRRFMKSEDGAELIEATLIYPFVFLCLAFLLYMGIYMMQYMTVQAYAEKIAMFAARDLASPGYITMIAGSKQNEVFGTSATEVNLDVKKNDSGQGTMQDGYANINFDPKKIDFKVYRYWNFDDPLEENTKNTLNNMLTNLVSSNSMVCSRGVQTKISCKNYFLVQYVNVSVTQELENFELFEFFGIDNPTVKVHAKCAVNDVDEFIRTTDFAVDSLEMMAGKLGVDVEGLKAKIIKAKNDLHLN